MRAPIVGLCLGLTALVPLIGCDDESSAGRDSADGGAGDAGAASVAGSGAAAGDTAGAATDDDGGDPAEGGASGVGGDASLEDASAGVGFDGSAPDTDASVDASASDAGFDGSFSDTDAGQVLTTVQEIQQENATGMVTLNDVYVTAIDDLGPSKAIWVADALSAAAWHGINVLTGTALPAVTLGERVSLTGTVTEFDVQPVAGDTLTRIASSADQITGTGVIGSPAPLTVAPEVLSDITGGEAYEGVLVRIGPVRVIVLGPGNRITVSDNGGYTLFVEYDLYATTPAVDACFASITGVMHVNLFDDVRTLLPRAASDLVEGSGCN